MVGWCCLCRCNGENVAHLLLHCPVARELWNYVFRRFGVDWVISGSVLDHLAGWRNWFGKHDSDVWNLVPACVMWSLWREKNNRTFHKLAYFLAIRSCNMNAILITQYEIIIVFTKLYGVHNSVLSP
jgi:hypothetical protein